MRGESGVNDSDIVVTFEQVLVPKERPSSQCQGTQVGLLKNVRKCALTVKTQEFEPCIK